MTEQILFICTGNICRSPMAAAIAGRLAEKRSVDALFSTAGTMSGVRFPTAEMLAAMSDRGFDLTTHRSRYFEDALGTEPDLVICMERHHAREVVELDQALFDRTFILRDLVRRAETAGPRVPNESLPDYLSRLSTSRKLSDLVGVSTADDIPDPIGRPRAEYERCARELEDLLGSLFDALWPRSGDGAQEIQM